MRVCVTGATGFIGGRLVAELARRGWECLCVHRGGGKSEDRDNLSWIRADLSEPSSLDSILSTGRAVDVFFHLGAMMPSHKTEEDFSAYMTSNALATARLLEIAKASGAGAFVYASSIGVIGKPRKPPVAEDHPVSPVGPYFLGKICGEMTCESFGLSCDMRVMSLRVTSPYGERMPHASVLPFFVSRAMESRDLELYGSGERTQNFIHVEDAVNAFILAAENGETGVYNIGGAESVSMNNLAKSVVRLTPGCKSAIVHGEKQDPQDDYRWEIDIGKARAGFEYAPRIGLEQGLAGYINWRRAGQA